MAKYKRESHPYRAARQFEKSVTVPVENRSFVVYRDFVRSFLRVRVNQKKLREELRKGKQFKIDGKVYINPKTGKPLKKREWEEIKRSLDVAFSFVYDKATEEAIAKKAVLLGRLLTAMDTNARLNPLQLSREMELAPRYTYLLNEIQFAEAHAGELITGLTATAKKRVTTEIINGQLERITPKELESRLFHTYINVNRDWRRIAETEIANNINTGYLKTELEKGTKYLRGLSSADACPFCKANVDGKVVVLGDQPNQTGFVFDKTLGREVPYVWPGKSNYGRPRRDWWVASGAQHPHCRCSWQGYEPGIEESEKRIEERLAAMLAAEN